MIDGGEESDDDCKDGELTAFSYHRAAAVGSCRMTGSWNLCQCRNPCLRPCLMLLKDSGEVVVTGKEEPDWVIKGIS